MSKNVEVRNIVLMKDRKNPDGSPSNLLAMCNLRLAGDYQVNGLRVIKGSNGPFVSMPGRMKTKRVEKGEQYLARIDKDGTEVFETAEKTGYFPAVNPETGRVEYDDIFHASTTDSHNVLQAAVLNAYAAAKAQEAAKDASGDTQA